MTLEQVQAFLTLCEELHFGRTAERLYRSQSRVSRLILSLETELGGALFERTSRRVLLTPLGGQFERRLRPAYTQLLSAAAEATAAAHSATGALRVGLPSTLNDDVLFEIVRAFAHEHPQCEVTVSEIDGLRPYAALRAREIDLLCNWLAVDEPDLAISPPIDHRDRVLAVSSHHRLAGHNAVSIEELARERVNRLPQDYPAALQEAMLPTFTPSGRPISRNDRVIASTADAIAEITHGRSVHLTVEGQARFMANPDIVLIPVHDMPELPIGLIWLKDRPTPSLLAFVKTAATTSHPTAR